MSGKMATGTNKWTKEQWQAITRKGTNVLVAAAAGSGKTAVLVERIIRRIVEPTDPVSVDKLLVVTFTNAAAAEMRQRIGDALRKALKASPDSVHLRRQLMLLSRATITTIHSFCLGLLRQYYYMVDLDPEFRVADQMEAELLRQDVLEAKLEEWYEHDQEFCAFADLLLDGQDDARLQSLLLRLHDFSRSHPEPALWLQQAADMFPQAAAASLGGLPWTDSLLKTVRLQLAAAASNMRKALLLASSPEGPAAYVSLLEREYAGIAAAVDACNEGWNAVTTAVRAISFGRLSPAKEGDPLVKEQVQALRSQAKDRVAKLTEEFFALEPEQYLRDLAKMAPYMGTLARIVREFDREFFREKQARSIVDFADLEHLALRVLSEGCDGGEWKPSPIARQLREQYEEVLVDEYQDTNLVQETILGLVSRGPEEQAANRFMVGDVKQSIYRFRLAEPNLFLAKYRSYRRTGSDEAQAGADSLAADGVRIDLAANFRSRREVVDAVNFLFRQIMSPGVGEIAYDSSAELVFKAEDYPEADPERMAVELHLVDRASSAEPAAAEAEEAEPVAVEDGVSPEQASREEEEAARLEARLIARRIRELVTPQQGEPFTVFDKETKTNRAVRYRDIVVLLRATAGWAQVMTEEFRSAGIPVYADGSEGYFAATEVDVMLSLLRVIDNPRQDIPLAAVLRSPLVGLSEPQLAEMRVCYPNVPYHEAVWRFAAEQSEQDVPWLRVLRAFLRKLEEWRTRARRGPLADLIATVYRETGYLDYVGSLPNGRQRQGNLLSLYDRARQYEATSYRGLFRFLRLIDRIQQQGSDWSEARTVGESEDVVRIMTIHKSKGLEFPVVFVAGLGKPFNLTDLKKEFLLHKELGFGPLVSDPQLRLRYPSLAYLGIREQLRREMLAEEMRVLYVALTRAREKLLLVGSLRDLAKNAVRWCDQAGEENRLADEDLFRAATFLDWIGRSLVRHPSGSLFRDIAREQAGDIRVVSVPDRSVWTFQLYQPSDLAPSDQQTELDEDIWRRILHLQPIGEEGESAWGEQVRRILEWQYGSEALAGIAAKWSVSDLKQHVMEQADEAAEWGANKPRRIRLPQISQKPRYLAEPPAKPHVNAAGREGALEVEDTVNKAVGHAPGHRNGGWDLPEHDSGPFSRAEIGTFMHLVMQHLDISRPCDEEDVQEQLAGLVDREYLGMHQAAQVNVQQIAAFFRSELGKRVKQAKRLYRELPFTLALPAAEIGGHGTGDDMVIVQGVIDCVAEEADGKLLLIDFKTDAINGILTPSLLAELEARYREQIGLYARALASIWKREVDERYLYYFSAGAAIPVGRE